MVLSVGYVLVMIMSHVCCIFNLSRRLCGYGINNAKKGGFHNGFGHDNFLGISRSLCVIRSEEFDQRSLEDITHLANGNAALKEILALRLLEVNRLRESKGRVPKVIKPDEWRELALLETKRARRKYLEFCWKKRIARENVYLKKEGLKLKRDDFLKYKLALPSHPSNTMFLPFHDKFRNRFLNARLIQAILFNQEIVVDCGYDAFMSRREALNCGKQLMYVFSTNRANPQPFNLYFCNIQRESRIIREFLKFVKTAYEPHFPLNMTEKCYLELFHKERLVYLTPHCSDVLECFDHEAVYIVGGIVDKGKKIPMSMEKATEHGLRMVKLPLDEHVSWAPGSGKCLTLDQTINILLDMKLTQNWKIALKHIPKRKVSKIINK